MGINKKILSSFIVIAILLSVCIGYYIITQNQKQAISEQNSTLFYTTDDILINLNNSSALLKIQLNLEVLGDKNLSAVQNAMPQILDMMQIYLRELRPEDLKGSYVMYKMKDEFLLRINTLIYPANISKVLFKTFIIQ